MVRMKFNQMYQGGLWLGLSLAAFSAPISAEQPDDDQKFILVIPQVVELPLRFSYQNLAGVRFTSDDKKFPFRKEMLDDIHMHWADITVERLLRRYHRDAISNLLLQSQVRILKDIYFGDQPQVVREDFETRFRNNPIQVLEELIHEQYRSTRIEFWLEFYDWKDNYRSAGYLSVKLFDEDNELVKSLPEVYSFQNPSLSGDLLLDTLLNVLKQDKAEAWRVNAVPFLTIRYRTGDPGIDIDRPILTDSPKNILRFWNDASDGDRALSINTYGWMIGSLDQKWDEKKVGRDLNEIFSTKYHWWDYETYDRMKGNAARESLQILLTKYRATTIEFIFNLPKDDLKLIDSDDFISIRLFDENGKPVAYFRNAHEVEVADIKQRNFIVRVVRDCLRMEPTWTIALPQVLPTERTTSRSHSEPRP